MCSECLGHIGLWENKEDWHLRDLRLTDRYNTVVIIPAVSRRGYRVKGATMGEDTPCWRPSKSLTTFYHQSEEMRPLGQRCAGEENVM